MSSSLAAVLENITKGKPAPCYLIHGNQTYLVKDALERIVGALLPGGADDFSLFRMTGDTEDVGAITESLLSRSLIPGRKVIVVRDTRLFYSKSSVSDIIDDVRDNLQRDPSRAARSFAVFLETVGWSLEELKDGGWNKISDAQWRKAVDGEAGGDREQWLPRAIHLCESLIISTGKTRRDTDQLEDALKRGIPRENTLILTADAVDRRKRLFKVISELGIVLEFQQARNEARQKQILSEVVREYLEKNGKTLSPEAMALLRTRTGFGLGDIMGELEKLISYVDDRHRIGADDVDAVIGKTKEDSIFDLTAAVVDGDPEKALATLEHLLDQGVHYLSVLAMIAREMLNLLQGKLLLDAGVVPSFSTRLTFPAFQKDQYPVIKEAARNWEAGGGWLIGRHPYVIYNALSGSIRFSYEELEFFIDRLADLDVALKTTAIDPRRALEKLLIELCRR
ncbi:MAG: DNA polymerase III subunit delta [Deltaproteobacteria bacterium]|nr:DNA polymerase III subunit delta [Deltaproteobacteria bacterium]